VRTASRPPGEFLRPQISEERVRQTWAKIQARQGARRPASGAMPVVMKWAFVPAALVALGVGAFAVLRRPAPRMAVGGGLTIASEAEPRSFELAEAQIELQPFASVTVGSAQPFEQRLAVTRGAVRFHVVHDPARRFVVTAGGVEVDDVGTVFTVAREGKDGELVRVSVASGDVQVRVGSQAPRPLHEGESLTTPEPLPEAPSGSPPAPERPPSVSVGASAATSVPSSNAVVDASPPSESPPPPPPPVGAARSADPISAKGLLAAATAARQAGDLSAEAQALDTLRRRFPRDPRAPIAGFELGIIRMDQLGNRRGALEALRAAIALGPGASFREDAEARIVVLLDELDDATGCSASRDAFLARYPESVHRASVQRRCQTR
jgi:hypothetical protein